MKLQRYRLHFPLLEARVHYRVLTRQGTDLEATVLQLACEEGRLSLRRLQDLLPLPAGAIALMIADLMRWRCLTQLPGPAGTAEYQATALGRRIAKKQAEFPEVEMDSGYFHVFAEPLAGLVAHADDVDFLSAQDLPSDGNPDTGFGKIPVAELAPAAFAEALMRQQAIEVRTGRDRPDTRYEFVDVEFRAWKGRYHRVDVYEGEGGRFCEGLPRSWHRLEALVLEQLDQHRNQMKPEPIEIVESQHQKLTAEPPLMEPVSAAGLELWAGNQRHLDGLRQALQRAHSHVLIASAFLGDTRGSNFSADLEAALQRGVDVTLLWGGYAEANATAEARRYSSKGWKKLGLAAPGRLRCLLTPSISHAKYLVWDEQTDAGIQARTAVGSCNWLSNRVGHADFPLANVSLCLGDPTVLTRLTQHIGIMARLSGTSEWQEFGKAWRLFVQGLSKGSSPAKGPALGCWLFDTENVLSMIELTAAARERLAVVSNRTGIAREHRLVALRDRPVGAPAPIVIHDDQFPAPEIEGCTPTAKAHMHSKFVLSDETVLISSCNFLAADARLRASHGQEIGFMVKSRTLADQLQQLLLE